MIIETITVTTTPATILSLLETARGTARTKNGKITGYLFRVNPTETEPVLVEEADTSSAVTLLDPANDQPFASFTDFDLNQSLLSVASGTVAVGIIISQDGAGQ